jgi:nitroreductase
VEEAFEEMNIKDTIEKRRAIYPKEFNGETIEDSTVQDLLENAHKAPSHGNTRPWLFKVFKEEALDTLIEQFKKHHLQYTSPEKVESKLEKVEKHKTQCSHIVAICVKPSIKHPIVEDTNAVAMAVQNLWLSLVNYPKIGGYWSSGNGTYTPEMDAFLDLSDGSFCMGFFLLGCVDEKRTESPDIPLGGNVEWV